MNASRKLLVSGTSAGIAVLAAWAWLGTRGADKTVELVDNRAEIAELLDGAPPLDPAAPATPAGDAPWPPALVRRPLDQETAARFFPGLKNKAIWDPLLFVRAAGPAKSFTRFPEHPAGGFEVRTNSLGMREDFEVGSVRPDVRIVVTGDSHTDGVCANSESFPNVLEALLAAERPGQTVEVWNAGMGGYQLFNYLGALERYGELAPQVFVVAIYGGNDYSTALNMYRYFRGLPAPAFGPLTPRRLLEGGGEFEAVAGQDLNQVLHFLNNPGDVALAIEMTAAILVEMERICREAGSALVCVYVPPPSCAQPRFFTDVLERASTVLGIDPAAERVSDTIADGWLAFLAERGVPAVDLRPALRTAEVPCFWRTDLHLNVEGCALAAGALLPVVRDVLGR